MDKYSSRYQTIDLARQRPTMARTKSARRVRAENAAGAKGSGVLFARRRKDRFGIALKLVLTGLVCLWCLGFSWLSVTAMRGNAARHQQARVAKLTATVEATSVPVAAAPVEGKKKSTRTNILLLGSDEREGEGGFRTDIILLLSIDAAAKTVSAVSFPRDLWVEPPGMDGMKINMVQGLGGFEATQSMFETSFGVYPDYYVQTNFQGFRNIIDSLGGVDVEIGQELTDDCDLPQQVDGDCTVVPGMQHMDGATALWYVRSRHTSSDFDRMRRMQEVMTAAFKRLMSLNALSHIAELYDEFSGSVETNLRIKEILRLAPVASEVFGDRERIRTAAVGEEYGTEMLSWNGMWILLPDLPRVQELLRETGVE
jgi:LCP family protein required for cell wall assembly